MRLPVRPGAGVDGVLRALPGAEGRGRSNPKLQIGPDRGDPEGADPGSGSSRRPVTGTNVTSAGYRGWARADPGVERSAVQPHGDRSNGTLPDPPGLGITFSRTGSGRNVPAFRLARRSSRKPGAPMLSSMSATVRPSTPGVREPWLPATRENATISVAGSHTKLNRSSKRRPGSDLLK